MTDDYLHFFKSDNTVILTERLRIRRMSRRDRSDMYEYARLPEVSEYLLWRPHASEDSTKRYLDYVTSLYRSGDFFDFAIEYRQNGKMIGTCGFAAIDKNNDCAEVGYVLSPEYWGKGIATEALTAMLRFGFCDLGVNRIEARYMTENTASRRVMEKCGMIYEGTYRKKLLVKGQFRDTGVCALLSEDYFAVNEKKSALAATGGRFLGIISVKR